MFSFLLSLAGCGNPATGKPVDADCEIINRVFTRMFHQPARKHQHDAATESGRSGRCEGAYMPDIIVKNQNELDAALRAATGGETIKLLAGTYSSAQVSGKNFASNVTITSADPDHPATIQSVSVSNTSNLTFKSLGIGRQMTEADASYTQLTNVTSSSNIVFDAVHVSGGNGNPADSRGWGFTVRTSSNVTIQNSTLDHLGYGLSVGNSDGILIKNNVITDNRTDAMNITEVSNIVIDGNLITNTYPAPGEHPDAIQFFTKGTTKASSNIVIKNNIIMQGSGGGTQGIFLGDEGGSFPYTNVNISNNLVYMSTMYNGISVANGVNVNIQNNTVSSPSNDGASLWISLVKVDGGTVANNVADVIKMAADATNITQGNNRLLQNDAALLREFGNLNALSGAKVSGFIVDGVGYHPPIGSAAAKLVTAELAAAKPSPTKNLMLDLEFKPAGVVDQSRFGSSATVDLTAISSNTYHVQNGKGFEVSRGSVLQIFALPAMTLTFDLQRDSASAATGQVMGVFKGWAVSLQSNGELNFTVTNSAGKTYSITTQGAKLVDTKTHKIGITYDGASGRAIIYIDNVAKGTGAVSGVMKSQESWSLYVGNQFGAAFSGRIGSVEIRDQALSPAQLATLSTASDFGLTKNSSSFAGIVGQIANGRQSADASKVVAPADTGNAGAALQSAASGSIASISSISSLSSNAAPKSAAASLWLSSMELKRPNLDLFHA